MVERDLAAEGIVVSTASVWADLRYPGPVGKGSLLCILALISA